ncbi:hypothetical protein PybrP1_001342, partial [[Pythium] brassicae (nom. inval.)]
MTIHGTLVWRHFLKISSSRCGDKEAMAPPTKPPSTPSTVPPSTSSTAEQQSTDPEQQQPPTSSGVMAPSAADATPTSAANEEHGDEDVVVTLDEVLRQDAVLSETADAVLGASSATECSYALGYHRQALYACLTCTPASDDDAARAGVCLACSYSCHENHELVELYTKRNFRCDCGNAKFPSDNPCKLVSDKAPRNEQNVYSQNFAGKYCTCHRPYPDPERATEEVMLQCVVCEDWLHDEHVFPAAAASGSGEPRESVPADFDDFICVACMAKHPFLLAYDMDDDESGGPGPGDDDTARDAPPPPPPCLLEKKLAAMAASEHTAELTTARPTFWAREWRDALCKCAKCVARFEKARVAFLLDPEDSLQAYEEAAARARRGSGSSVEDLAQRAFSATLSHEQQVEVAIGYSHMKSSLHEYLAGFASGGKTLPGEREDLRRQRGLGGQRLAGRRCLDLGGQPRALVDRALGVELAGLVRAADAEDRDALALERRLELAQRDLPGAHDHVVHSQHVCSALLVCVVQPSVVHLVVRHAAEHRHGAVLERQAVDPAGRLAQVLPVLGRLALQQEDLARGRRQLRRDARDAAAHRVAQVDAPLLREQPRVEARRRARVRQELGHVEADAAGADHGHALAHGRAVLEHVNVAQHLRVVAARDLERARQHARGDHDLVEAGGRELVGRHAPAELHAHARELELLLKVPQRLVELLLARHDLGHVELPADRVCLVEQRHVVAARGRRGRERQPSGARTDHRDALRTSDSQRGRTLGRREVELRLVARARVHEAAGRDALERVVETRLVAPDARVDLVLAPLLRLAHELRVREERTCHRHHVCAAPRRELHDRPLKSPLYTLYTQRRPLRTCVAVRNDAVTHVGGVDAVRRDERDADLAHHLLGHPRVAGAGHARRDRWHARLVPANARVDDRRAGALDRLRELHDLVPRAAFLDQVEHREPVDDDEVVAHSRAHGLDDLDREADAVRVRAAPLVRPLVRVLDDELVDQVPFRAHDLHTVVPGRARVRRALRVVADRALHAAGRERARREPADRRLDRRRRHVKRVVPVPAAVQDLHGDLAAVLVHRGGHLLVRVDLAARRELRRQGAHAAGAVRRDAADAAAAPNEPFGEERGEAREGFPLLQPRVHGAHEHAVLELREAQVERLQQVWVLAHGGRAG